MLREDEEVIGEYLLHKESMTIGRNPDNDICIDDSVVSSYHARILTHGDRSYVYDLNSTNGTYVNSRPIKKHRVLKHGDVITITKYQIKYSVFDSIEEGMAGDGTVVGDGDDTVVADPEGNTGQRKMWRDTIDTRTLSS